MRYARSVAPRSASILPKNATLLLIGGLASCAASGTDPAANDPAGAKGEANACSEVVCVESFPASLKGTTTDSTLRSYDHYACDPSITLSGSEVIYRLTLPTDGLVIAKLGASVAGQAVRLLSQNDPERCVDAHGSRVAAWMPAGEAFLVVDSAEGAEGSFSLDVNLVTAVTFTAAGVGEQTAADALAVFKNAWAWGATRRTEYVIVDFTQYSTKEREWVFDLATGELLWKLRVAHGRKSSGTDLGQAVKFSNENGSNQSSLGLLRSAGPYVGTFGPSFRLEGLEPGFNDNVCKRDIVMHPWSPMGDEYVKRCGWARPSLGCPAIDSALSQPVRDRLARPDGAPLNEGVAMLFWFPGTDWQANSPYLHGTTPSTEVTGVLSQTCDSSTDTTPTPPASGDYDCD